MRPQCCPRTVTTRHRPPVPSLPLDLTELSLLGRKPAQQRGREPPSPGEIQAEARTLVMISASETLDPPGPHQPEAVLGPYPVSTPVPGRQGRAGFCLWRPGAVQRASFPTCREILSAPVHPLEIAQSPGDAACPRAHSWGFDVAIACPQREVERRSPEQRRTGLPRDHRHLFSSPALGAPLVSPGPGGRGGDAVRLAGDRRPTIEARTEGWRMAPTLTPPFRGQQPPDIGSQWQEEHSRC